MLFILVPPPLWAGGYEPSTSVMVRGLPDAGFAERMDRYMILEQLATAARIDTVALIEARALADEGEDLLAWGEAELALTMVDEAVELLEATGLEVPAGADQASRAGETAPAASSPVTPPPGHSSSSP